MAMVLTSLRLVNGSGTTSSEVFDDYEEGTFTIGFNQSGATITANSWQHNERYTKSGKFVIYSDILELVL